MERLGKRWLIQGLIGLGAGLVLGALLWLPWRTQAGRAVALDAPVAWAASVISGTVSWKGTDTPVAGVRVILRDPQAGAALTEAATDALGVYYLSAGVGDWIVDVPSTAQYWGYTQVLTAYPHQDYHRDFGITVRPPDPTPVAGVVLVTGNVQAALPPQSAPAAVPPGKAGAPPPVQASVPVAAAGTAPGKLPPAGQPAVPPRLPPSGNPLPWWLLSGAAAALIAAGRLLRGRCSAGIPV